MGQQQLLLIVLGVIVVGIAVVVGISLFNANSQSANRDAVIADLNNLSAMALQYYRKPKSMAGGSNTFTGFDSTKVSGLTTTANGHYVITASAQSVTIVGTGTTAGNDKTNPVKATATVIPTSTVTVVINN